MQENPLETEVEIWDWWFCNGKAHIIAEVGDRLFLMERELT